MQRRLHASRVTVGEIPLDPVQARHARDVLRLPEGATVELFDHDGNVGLGTLLYGRGEAVIVKVEQVANQTGAGVQIIVASAIPKGERADWMVEKLSELGTATFIPLAAERSVTLPAGKSKFERWTRIATESAKQSRRVGVMGIEQLTSVYELIGSRPAGFVLSTAPGSKPLQQTVEAVAGEILLAIGPEGGWTERELAKFSEAGYVEAGLTQSILRTETAAITAAAVVAVMKSNPSKAAGTRD